jgi:general secretion pathway protein D
MSVKKSIFVLNQHRYKALLIFFLILQLTACAGQRAYHRAQSAAKRADWDRAVAEYMVAMEKSPDNAQYRAGFERARLAASQVHLEKAKQFMEKRNYEQGIIEYQVAQNFDPTNQFIQIELQKAKNLFDRESKKVQLTAIEKAKQDAKRRMPINVVLGPEAEKTIQSLRFRDDSLKHILDSLGSVAGINIVYDSDFRDQEFSVSLDNIKFRDALNQILVANRLYFKPLDQSTILIIPDNPQKRRQYDEQVIQTFYLSNAELNDVLNMVRSVMQIQRIATNPQLNAITIRDTPDKVAIVQKIIEANDKSRSEILLDIEILEVDRDQAMRYGVDLTNYSVTQTLEMNAEPNVLFGHQLSAIDAASWSFTIPSIVYTALATDQRTKILAKPQIRASEGQQVTVRLGDRVPIPVTVFQAVVPNQQLGVTVPTTTFQLTDVGINIDVTPRVHHNREISLTMRFELTSITAPGVGTTPPTLGNRTVNTVIRLKDGETNLLAGLLRRDERKSLRGIPGIIKVPFLRDLFASNDKGLQEKDIIFTITPHILRTPNVTEEDLTPIWIGTEDDVKLKSAPPISVFERPDVKNPGQPFEGEQQPSDQNPQETTPPVEEQQPPTTPPTGGTTEQPQEQQQVVPEPQTQPEETEPQVQQPITEPGTQVPEETETQTQPQAEPVAPQVTPEAGQNTDQSPNPQAQATISFSSPNVNPTVNTDIIVHVQMQNAMKATSLSIFLDFDAENLQVKDVLQGAFVNGAFSKSFDNERGTVGITASRSPGTLQSGVAATLVFTGLRSGQTLVNLESAVIRDGDGNVIPVTFLPYPIAVQ